MRGILCYFSGTGNTKWVGDRFVECFKFYGTKLELYNIEMKDPLNLEGYDFLVIGTPVHGDMPPSIVMDFVGRLPQGNKRKVFIYATLRGSFSPAADVIKRTLLKKDYNIVNKSLIRMPNNSYFLWGKKPSPVQIEELLNEAKVRVKDITIEFFREKKKDKDYSAYRIAIAKIKREFLRRGLPNFSRNISSIEACTKCGICLRNCPKGNVTFEKGHAVFHSNCILCLRCLYICPINGITFKGKKISKTKKEILGSLDLR